MSAAAFFVGRAESGPEAACVITSGEGSEHTQMGQEDSDVAPREAHIQLRVLLSSYK